RRPLVAEVSFSLSSLGGGMVRVGALVAARGGDYSWGYSCTRRDGWRSGGPEVSQVHPRPYPCRYNVDLERNVQDATRTSKLGKRSKTGISEAQTCLLYHRAQ